MLKPQRTYFDFFPFFSFFINIGSQYLHTTAEIILVVLDKLFVLIALSTTDAIAYDISQLLNRVSLRDTVQSLPQMISASAQRPFSCACRFHGDQLFDHPHSFTVDTTISFPGKGFIVSQRKKRKDLCIYFGKSATHTSLAALVTTLRVTANYPGNYL